MTDLETAYPERPAGWEPGEERNPTPPPQRLFHETVLDVGNSSRLDAFVGDVPRPRNRDDVEATDPFDTDLHRVDDDVQRRTSDRARTMVALNMKGCEDAPRSEAQDVERSDLYNGKTPRALPSRALPMTRRAACPARVDGVERRSSVLHRAVAGAKPPSLRTGSHATEGTYDTRGVGALIQAGSKHEATIKHMGGIGMHDRDAVTDTGRSAAYDAQQAAMASAPRTSVRPDLDPLAHNTRRRSAFYDAASKPGDVQTSDQVELEQIEFTSGKESLTMQAIARAALTLGTADATPARASIKTQTGTSAFALAAATFGMGSSDSTKVPEPPREIARPDEMHALIRGQMPLGTADSRTAREAIALHADTVPLRAAAAGQEVPTARIGPYHVEDYDGGRKGDLHVSAMRAGGHGRSGGFGAHRIDPRAKGGVLDMVRRRVNSLMGVPLRDEHPLAEDPRTLATYHGDVRPAAAPTARLGEDTTVTAPMDRAAADVITGGRAAQAGAEARPWANDASVVELGVGKQNAEKQRMASGHTPGLLSDRTNEEQARIPTSQHVHLRSNVGEAPRTSGRETPRTLARRTPMPGVNIRVLVGADHNGLRSG